ncbi:hypothetical protein MKZ38_001654 [Zalerion maritima]|uniref:Uncharacterized protein n=1 Tax=Zalerion maritima TaxID=339359 RepID=A0AAD5WRB7_9PEZI|nr:hypothetical protein MKZ38_001654 [Zalerion maritima]
MPIHCHHNEIEPILDEAYILSIIIQLAVTDFLVTLAFRYAPKPTAPLLYHYAALGILGFASLAALAWIAHQILGFLSSSLSLGLLGMTCGIVVTSHVRWHFHFQHHVEFRRRIPDREYTMAEPISDHARQMKDHNPFRPIMMASGAVPHPHGNDGYKDWAPGLEAGTKSPLTSTNSQQTAPLYDSDCGSSFGMGSRMNAALEGLALGEEERQQWYTEATFRMGGPPSRREPKSAVAGRMIYFVPAPPW